MDAVTDSAVRASFVNCSKGEAKRLSLPRDLGDRPWADLDFLGWRDAAAPQKAYLVAPVGGGLTGVALRIAAAAGRPRRSMCSLCLTTHPGDGVALMTARKAGKSGQLGNSVGTYACADLACSLYLRGLRPVAPGGRLTEALSRDEQVARLEASLHAFLASVVG